MIGGPRVVFFSRSFRVTVTISTPRSRRILRDAVLPTCSRFRERIFRFSPLSSSEPESGLPENAYRSAFRLSPCFFRLVRGKLSVARPCPHFRVSRLRDNCDWPSFTPPSASCCRIARANDDQSGRNSLACVHPFRHRSLGIGSFGERFLDLIERYFPRKYGSDLAASVGAQLMTAPVIAIAIGTLAPLGIVASCLIAPLTSVFLLVGCGLLAVSAVLPALSPFAGHILDSLYCLIAQPAHFLARCPVIEVRVLPAVIAASIIPLATGATLAFLSAAIRKRRSCDDGFARL